MKNKILDINHPLYQFMLRMVWVFVFNTVFMITCAPMIYLTLLAGPLVGLAGCIVIGPSAVGCAGVFLKLTDDVQENWFKVYGRLFIKRLHVSLVYEILALIVTLVLVSDYYYFSRESGALKIVGLGVAGIFTVVAVIFFVGVLYITAKFQFGIMDTGRAVALFITKNLKLALAAAVMFAVLTVGIGVLMILVRYFTWMVIIFLGLGFYSAAYAYNAIFYRYFDEDEVDFEEEEKKNFAVLCDRLEKFQS